MKQRGFSLIEITLAMGITSIVTIGAATIMARTADMQARTNMQSSVDSLFLVSMQMARNVVTSDPGQPHMAIDEGLRECLSGAGVNCTDYANVEKPLGSSNPATAAFDAEMNSYYSTSGRCVSGSSPKCTIQRSTTYHWICENARSCSGIQVKVAVTPQSVGKNGALGPSESLRARTGTFSAPKENFTSKSQIAFDCQGAQGLSLNGVDYADFQAKCANVPREPACAMPAKQFGKGNLVENCQPAQTANCSANGFNRLGLYSSQNTCEIGWVITAVPATPTPTPIPTAVPTAVPTAIPATPIPTPGPTPATEPTHGCLHGHYFNNTASGIVGAQLMALPLCPANTNAPCYSFNQFCKAQGAPGHWEPLICSQGANFGESEYCPYDPPGMCNGAPYTAAPSAYQWTPTGETVSGNPAPFCGFTPNGVRDCETAGDICYSFKSFGANPSIRIYDKNVCQ